MKQKTIFSVVLAFVMVLSSMSYTFASESENTTKNMIIDALTIITEIADEQFDNLREDILLQAINDNQDYDRTFMTIEKPETWDNPIEIVTVLSIISEKVPISDVSFYKYKYKEKAEESFVPTKYTPFYINENGEYKKGRTMYATEETNVLVCDETENGYVNPHTITITPDITQIPYWKVKISLKSPKELYEEYIGDYPEDIMIEITENLYEKSVKDEVDEKILKVIGLVNVRYTPNPTPLTSEKQDVFNNALLTTSSNRRNLITTALSLYGKIPYMWGGKPLRRGYDITWWSFNEDTGKMNGLDCSGFVEWATWTAGYDNHSSLISTSAIMKNCEEISKEELLPGDLGILNDGVGKINHTGIYIGDGYFIHCAGSGNGVIMTKCPFKYFYRIPDIEETDSYVWEPFKDKIKRPLSYNNEELYMLAQLVSHEAKGEGLNGWIAVAEVVKNRVESSLFQNTIKDVIYAPGQFEKVEDIIYEEPNNSLINAVAGVLDGKISVLNNPNVLFFKNTDITGDGGIDGKADWGKYKYYTKINHHTFYSVS